ncbi:site-2 protease. Metallo peptidase. MEROPS family M50B [Sphingomonas palmae]|uniref:Site-2 protease. Metallo peptidase. MEROPS family M50B n=1 Tax=Sphingomonas palmae TaxID=1855283 RepID=A0A1H7GHT0_9SPHN|nr:M50 family metallopeptidase [Sphingomonas palmae]SEK37097.1 site-2 protease. Metallo peptidase. MEROPS family M50B [Sphingomonas palmae]
MIQTPGLLLTILAFALVIGPLVFIHELGHYLAGRCCGVKAEAFSIGFGREIAGWTDRRGTRWRLALLPLGGYVKFAGDMSAAGRSDPDWLLLPPEERAQTFQAKPVWQRAIIVAAGPAINFLFAILILTGFALAYGDAQTPAVVGQAMPGTAAAQADLRPGDKIDALGGRHVDTFEDMVRYVKIRAGERVRIDYVRDGQADHVEAQIGTQEQRDRFGNEYKVGLLGIAPGNPVVRPVGMLEAPVVAVRRTGEIIEMMVETIGQIISGRRSVKELGGPLAIAKVSGEQITLGWDAFVFLLALVSINLGFINLLPVPMLDGGHLLFYLIEAVRQKPVGAQAQEWAYRGGLAAVLALMMLVTFNDLGNFGLWRHLAGLIG